MKNILDIELERRKPRKKVQLATGYESDSDAQADNDSGDSNESDVASQQKDSKGVSNKEETEGEKEDSGDDMFASDNEQTKPTGSASHKTDNVLDIDQFEKEQGLEDYSLREQANDSESFSGNSESEVKLEAFNLREEVESGKFDKDLNYIHGNNNSSDDEDEPWIADATAEQVKKARRAQVQSELIQLDQPKKVKHILALLRDLIVLLEPAETPMEAFSRLRPAKKHRKQKPDPEHDKLRKQQVFEITECCEHLVNDKGLSQAYDMSKEELMRVFRQETGEDFQAKGTKRSADQMDSHDNDEEEAVWEFRWLGESDVNGPFLSYEMNYWKENHFGNKVEVRRVPEEDFRHISEVTF